MTTPRNSGFILSIVLVLLIVTALIVSNLTKNTQALISQTDRQQVKAINRNMMLSAKAWIAQQGGLLPERIVLDVNSFSTRPTSLSIEPNKSDEIKIVTQSHWGRQKKSENYIVAIKEK